MKTQNDSRTIINRELTADLVVVGGGLSGVCAAIAGARYGLKVILVQDRPVLGGNASSEIRMGIMGAHGDLNKETGILEELQLDNIYYNPLMRYTMWDDVLYSAVINEKNITLLLNTSICEAETSDKRIESVIGWNMNEYCRYRIAGRYFADCSGDGILRLSGAEFRIGREAPAEFNEDFIQQGNDNRTMGNSILMQLRKCDGHRPFIAPPWAYHFTEETIPKMRNLMPERNNFWWIEYGGHIDTVGDAGAIQFELKKIAYGVWEYMKNHPDGRCAEYELDWIGSLPGKRESCRFVGDILLNQHDIMGGGKFPDTVCYGGWSLDDHHPDGFFRQGDQSTHHYPPSPFGIPYRALYSRNIDNLFFAGRNISCTHIGMSSTRVMATCALMGQAVGTAAALTVKYDCIPRMIYQEHIGELQEMLLDDDILIPGISRRVPQITLEAATDFDFLRNGSDRGESVNLKSGRAVVYEWNSPVTLSECRIVFNTELNAGGKRMRKLEATVEYKELPAMLTRGFRIEAKINNNWQEVLKEENNYHRLYRYSFPAVEVTAMRMIVDTVWGKDVNAEIFSLEFK